MSASRVADSKVADELAVRALVVRYCQAIVTRDDAAWADTFAEDGAWSVIGRSAVGRDAVLALYRELRGDAWVMQSASDAIIEIEGDTGRGRWQVNELIRLADGPALQNLGLYHDRYVRCPDGRWRFAERRFGAVYMGAPDLSGRVLPLPDGF